MKFKLNRNHLNYGLAALAATSLAIGCSKKKSDDSDTSSVPAAGSSLTLSGTIALTSTTATTSLADDEGDTTSAGLADLSSDKMNCTVFSDPPVSKTVTFDSSGKFSLDVSGTGYPMGCSVVDASGNQLSEFVFQDSSTKDLGGNAAKNARIALNGSADLGSIAADGDSGSTTIDTSKISNLASATVANPFDFTGTWSMDKADVLPDGYVAPCTEAEAAAARAANKDTCHGPTVGEKIWIKRLAGKTVADGSDSFAVQVWAAEDSFKACGSTLGFSYADAKSKAGIDLTSSGVAEGSFTWSTGWTDGWKNSAAKNGDWAMQDCNPTTYKGKEAYKCTDAAGHYNISLPGGCMNTTTNKPIQVQNWSQITGPTNTSETDSTTGLTRNIMTGTYSGSPIKCVNVFGAFNADGTTYSGNVTPQTLVAAGAKCSDIAETSDALKLMKLRCYANGYWSAKDSATGTVCIRKVNMDWSATDPTKFISDSDGPQKADSQHVLSLLRYTESGIASVHDEEDNYRTAQVNGQMVNCKMKEAFTLTMTRVTDTQAKAEFVMKTTMSDKGKPACVAQYPDSVSKSFMILNKQ